MHNNWEDLKMGGRSPRTRFPELHIKPFEQFEGFRTFTNFIEPLLPKKRTEQPCSVTRSTTVPLVIVKNNFLFREPPPYLHLSRN